MTIKDSIEKSVKPFTIFVVKEALFCKVHEQSAWCFAHAVRPYKSVKKFVKKLGSEVVSLGFPKSQLDSIQAWALEKRWKVTDETGWMEIRIDEDPDLPFDEWKQSVSLYADEKPMVSDWRADYPLREAISSIEDAIRSYNVADHTPMQCMQFIIDLQNKIKLVRKMPE